MDIASKLRDWQEGADPRLWKSILSPEFGERLDLERLTRDVMSRMESDLHTSLDWVAVSHFNTEHPHVHIALRGVDTRGEEFKLDREYVKNGLRSVAQHFATVQIGYRTEQNATAALRRQVAMQRFTPLDRMILARAQSDGVSGELRVEANATCPSWHRSRPSESNRCPWRTSFRSAPATCRTKLARRHFSGGPRAFARRGGFR